MNVSYWERESFLDAYDVCVIGAGIVGLAAASRYKELNTNARVAVLERSWLSDGASSKNAGFACFGSISELEDDLKNASFNQVLELSVKRYHGLQRLLELHGSDAIGYTSCGGFELFFKGEEELFDSCKLAFSKWNQAFEARLGFAPYSISECESFQGMNGLLGVITNSYEGALHTGKLNQCIRARALSCGVQLFHGIEVEEIIDTQEFPVVVKTKQGDWKCRQVLVCTNAFAKQLISDISITPKRNQVIVTNELDVCPIDGTFHQLEGYIYFRNIGNRILLGGMRHLFPQTEATTEQSTTLELIDTLSTYMSERILGHTHWSIDMKWSGILGMGEVKSPIIKRVNSNTYCAVRLGGMGVALGTIVGEEVVALMLEQSAQQ